MEFSRDQVSRYARHIILAGVGAEGQRRLLEGRVAVLGCGTVASWVVTYLAASGAGTISVPKTAVRDARDRVALLNPDVLVDELDDVTPTFARCDVRIGGTGLAVHCGWSESGGHVSLRAEGAGPCPDCVSGPWPCGEPLAAVLGTAVATEAVKLIVRVGEPLRERTLRFDARGVPA